MPLRGWIIPVGGSTPDRQKVGTLHPRQISAPNSKSGKTFPARIFLFSVIHPMLSRGWIIPVGGSTPDRHKDGTLHPRQISAPNSKSGKTFPA